MKKCIVIGGGFAGLSASVYLSNIGCKVELLEAAPKLGGRAYSFLHKESGTIVDNGQHLLMGCYEHTLNFLSLIGSLYKVQVQERMSVNFLKPGFELHKLEAASLPYPLNFFNAVLKFSAVAFKDRLSILRLFLKLPFLAEKDLEKLSVNEFLNRENQNENIKKAFWEILCVGALNTSMQKASSKMLVDILKIIFLKGSKGSRLVIPNEGLSETYCESAQQFVEKMHGSIFVSEKVEKIFIEKRKAVAIKTNKRVISNFDFVICAVPYYALKKILNKPEFEALQSNIHLFNPKYSSILNVHVWLRHNDFGNNFYGLIGSKVHWVFSRSTHLNCVISDADYLMPLSDEEIMNMIYSELKIYLNIEKEEITNYLILKEKRATFVPSKEILYNRPNTQTEIKNLLLAGDWVNTGLPSTIESAVKSGRLAAEFIMNASSN